MAKRRLQSAKKKENQPKKEHSRQTFGKLSINASTQRRTLVFLTLSTFEEKIRWYSSFLNYRTQRVLQNRFKIMGFQR